MPTERTTNPLDYQCLAQSVAVMGKSFAAGFHIPPHSHARDQLLYAVSGTMRVRTRTDAWIVPTDRAVYLPAHVEHSVTMRGPVEMRTLYIARDARCGLPSEPVVIAVNDLLRALVLSLLEEPLTYAAGTKADRIALLILDEIADSKPLAMSIPMPQDRRLLRLCEAIIREPGLSRSLDQWADEVGASRRTLARLFRLQCGSTFTVWRQRVRFHSAMEALSRGEGVAAVARQHGYESASAFTAAFRQMFGVTPRALSTTAATRPEPAA